MFSITLLFDVVSLNKIMSMVPGFSYLMVPGQEQVGTADTTLHVVLGRVTRRTGVGQQVEALLNNHGQHDVNG